MEGDCFGNQNDLRDEQALILGQLQHVYRVTFVSKYKVQLSLLEIFNLT